MKVEDKLINSPSLRLGSFQRSLFGVMTFLAWSVYIYLWIPLLTLLLWLLGFRTTYLQIYLQQQVVNLWLIGVLALFALGCALLLLGWAEYNRRRFAGLDRRGRQADVDLPEMAAGLGARTEDVIALQSASIATIRMSASAQPLGVDTRALRQDGALVRPFDGGRAGPAAAAPQSA